MTIQAYQFAGGYGTVAIPNATISSQRSPVTTDIISPAGNPYQIGQYWYNILTAQVYFYAGGGVWDLVSGPGVGPIDTLTGNSGGPIGPLAGNINLLGSNTTTVVGSGHTLTVTPTSAGYPITPYVVGPVGVAGYQTIQSAVTAAGLAGGGLVAIQGGTYTESLTLQANVSLYGLDSEVIIIGVHTPPTTSTNSITFDNLIFESTTDVLNSAAAGSTIINFNNCFFIITSGYVFNLLNWTGELLVDNCGEASTNDGVVNNTGGSQIKFINAELGAGTGKTMTITSSNIRFDTCNINCPSTLSGTGTLLMQNACIFRGNVTIGGALTTTILQTSFLTGSAQAITYNSSANANITGATINSSNNPAIGGTGAGVITLSGIMYLNNSSTAGTLTLTGTSNFVTSNLTAHGVLLAEGAGPIVATAVGATGQVLTGVTGADPVWTNLPAFNFVDVTGTSQAVAVNTTYIADNAGLVTFTLPATATQGSTFSIVGNGAGGWSVAQNANQVVKQNSNTTTTGTGGSVSSTNRYNSAVFYATVGGASTTWVIRDFSGTFTFV